MRGGGVSIVLALAGVDTGHFEGFVYPLDGNKDKGTSYNVLPGYLVKKGMLMLGFIVWIGPMLDEGHHRVP